MVKLINKLFLVLKFLLLVLAFIVTLYIVMIMYKRLGKNVVEAFCLFLPYVLLIGLFVINIIFKQKSVLDKLFYNLTCTLVFCLIIFVGLRSLFDKSMILNEIMGYGVNLLFFSDFIIFMNFLLYGLCVGNLLFMCKFKKEDIEIL